MTYKVELLIKQSTYQQLVDICEQLNSNVEQSFSKELGQIFTDLSCQVLEQLFGTLIAEQRDNSQLSARGAKSLQEAEQIFKQIEDALRKYMPWSISLLSNQRLKPVANYIVERFEQRELSQNVVMFYSLPEQLGESCYQDLQNMKLGDIENLERTLKNLVQVIDLGITEFIRTPKTLLDFNFVADKTLNGVINMITTMGYKRLEKIGDDYDSSDYGKLKRYGEHFSKFMVQA